MPLSQVGATYKNQAEIRHQNRLLGQALDDLASQIQATRAQGNFGLKGAPAAPVGPTALQVSSDGQGTISATVVDHAAAAGTQYVLQYSTTANFQDASTVTEVLTSVPEVTTSWQKSLPNSPPLYFRVAAKYPASAQGPWKYAGTSASPTSVNPGTASASSSAGIALVGNVQLQGQVISSAATLLANAPAGLYRAGLYVVCTAGGSTGTLNPSVSYTDDSGAQSQDYADWLNSSFSPGEPGASCTIEFFFEHTGGDIACAVALSVGTGVATYSFYATLEQILLT